MAKIVKRTHLVRHNIIHDGKMYKKGDTITFDPETDKEHIETLLKMGYLDGHYADELDEARKDLAKELGIHLITDEEVEVLWRRFLALTPEQRRALAERDARTKTDADAARIANIEETPQRPAPVDAAPLGADEDEKE